MMKNKILSTVLGMFLLPFYFGNVYTQYNDEHIDMTLIDKKKVKDFIISHKMDDFPELCKVKSSWEIDGDSNHYNYHSKTFFIKTNIKDVWYWYINANPIKAWSGRLIDFGVLVSKNTGAMLYKSKGVFSVLETGQVYFLNLKLLKGICNLPVAFEIIKVDEKRKVIEFSYIDCNVSKGKQVIQFIDQPDGTTQIIHTSYFKSDSAVRDGIYPFYHKRIIKDFHRNMRKKLKQVAKKSVVA